MNTSSRQLFLGTVVAIFFALTLALVAQPAPPAVEKSGPPAATPPAAAATPGAETPAPSAAATPTEPAVSISPPPPDAEPEKSDRKKKGGLRRLDLPDKEGATPPERSSRRRTSRGNSGDFPFGDHFVPKGGEIRDAVSIFGSTTVEGEVRSDAVSVMGSTRIGPEAKVGGSAVAVLGRLEVEGEVGGEAVGVLGSVTINGKVGQEVVSVLGDLHLGPNAEINGDVVLVGGKLTKDPAAIVRGNEINVPVLGAFGSTAWLTTWVKECAFKGRLLAFQRDLGWAWTVAFSFLAFYLLLALLFAPVIEKCALTFETRPGTSILSSVLTVLLTPVAMVLLAITVVGALLVPFLGAGLFFAGLFGKAVMLAWIGRRFTKFFGQGPLGHPVFAVLIGGIIVMLLYTVWGSFLLYKLLSWLGVGVVVLTIAQTMKREKAPVAAGTTGVPPVMPVAGDAGREVAPVASVPPPVVPVVPFGQTMPAMPDAPRPPVMPMDAGAPPAISPGFTGASVSTGPAETGAAAGFVSQPPAAAAGAAAMPRVASVTPPPARTFGATRPVVSANTLPRAGLFPRLAAMALDGILVGMVIGFSASLLPRFLQFHHGPGGLFLALAIYAAVMWKHKGTTIGGIVCGLKVVRLDQREIDWATAIVRALGCFLSLVVAGLGFIWVAFDDEKQSWHDKIAGTTVVLVPKGVSLL